MDNKPPWNQPEPESVNNISLAHEIQTRSETQQQQEPQPPEQSEAHTKYIRFKERRIQERNSLIERACNLQAGFFNYGPAENERLAFETYSRTLKTGIKVIDDNANGLKRGITTLCGGTSIGKTSFALNLAMRCLENNRNALCIYFGTESELQEMESRAIVYSLARQNEIASEKDYSTTIESGIKKDISASYVAWLLGTKVKDKDDTGPIRAKIDNGKQYVNGFVGNRFQVIPANFQLNGEDILYIVDRVKSSNPGKDILLVIDYLQAIRPAVDERTGRRLETRASIDDTLTAVESYSKAENIYTLLLSSVSRSAYYHYFTLAGAKESGGIEFTSDSVWGLQFQGIRSKEYLALGEKQVTEREEMFNKFKQEYPRHLELVCAKGRGLNSGWKAYFNHYPRLEFFESTENPVVPESGTSYETSGNGDSSSGSSYYSRAMNTAGCYEEGPESW